MKHHNNSNKKSTYKNPQNLLYIPPLLSLAKYTNKIVSTYRKKRKSHSQTMNFTNNERDDVINHESSDQSENDYTPDVPYQEKETICDCLKNNQHFDNLILDTKFKCSIEKFYSLVYASGFIFGFLREKNNDVNIGEWTKDYSGKKLVRESNYTKRLNKTPGEYMTFLKRNISPKTTKCYLKDEILHQNFEKYVTIMTTANTSDVPSGNTFTVKTRTCIIRAGSNTTRLIVTSTVEFSRHSLYKYKELEKAINKYISRNLDSETTSLPDYEDVKHNPTSDCETKSLPDYEEYVKHNPTMKESDSETKSLPDYEEDVKHNPTMKESDSETTSLPDYEDIKHNLTMKEKEKIIILNEDDKTDKARNKLKMPIIGTLVIITLLSTLIFNIYVSISISKVNDKVELIEYQNEAEVNIKFDLNEMLNELKRKRLPSVLDESSWDDKFNEYL